ncbi:MAG TPA: hypothetical protein VKK31_21765 [Thermoanaerobaculia bacterium]|nr:hypothetical protein [Thermoanaerobaculia bacterium]
MNATAAPLEVVLGPAGPPFRLEIPLRFRLAGADGFVLEPEGALLRAALEPLDFPLAGAALASRLAPGPDGALVVSLEAPRQVVRVRLAGHQERERDRLGRDRDRLPLLHDTLEFHRMDGDAVSEKPTATAAVRLRAATLDDDFVDARFALRLAGLSGPLPLAAGDVGRIDLRSYPATPRLHVLDPADPGSATPVWQVAGEVGKGVPAAAGAVDAGPELARALARLLERRLATLREEGAALPEELEMRLAVESDAPCRFVLSRLDVSYRLRLARLVSGQEKEVLRFPAGRVATAAVAVSLPRQARVRRASLRLAEGTRGHRPEGEGFADPASRSGARLAGETWAAQRIELAAPLAASGLAAAVLPLAAGTELAFELQADAAGRPAGEALAEAAVRLGEPGRPLWSTARLPLPVALPAGISWLLVRATRGAAVWLTAESATRLLLLSRGGPRRIWRDEGSLPGRSALWRLLAPAEPTGSEDSAFTLTVAGAVVGPSAREDFTDFDLTVPLAAALAAAAPGDGPVEIPLTFAAPAAASLTVYPPEVEYDLGGGSH